MQKMGAPILVLLAAGLVVGFLAPGGCPGSGSSMSTAAGAEFTNPVLRVGESEIFAQEFEQVASNMQAEAAANATQRLGAPELTPYESLSSYMQAMSSLARQGAILELGRIQNIEVDEEEMETVIRTMYEDQVVAQRQQFEVIQPLQIAPMEAELEKLKKDKAPVEQIANAEKELTEFKSLTFDKAFEQQSGMPPQQFVERQVTEVITRASQNSVIARSIEATAIQSKLNDKYGESVDTSDATIRASFDKIAFKQIMLSGPDAVAKAEEVKAKIDGGMNFDEAAKQFSMLKQPDGTVQLDTTTETRIDMVGDELREPLLDLEVNGVSEVVESAGTAYIYKLIAVRPDVPEGYEAAKAERIERLKTQQIMSKLNDAILGLTGETGEKVVWLDDGLKVLNAYMVAAGKPEQVEGLEAVLEQAEAADETLFPNVRALVRFMAITQLQVQVTDPAKKKELEAKMLEAYDAVLTISPSMDLRYQYINALIPAGKGDRALELLLDNAMAASTLGTQAEAEMTRIEQLLPKVSNQATKDNELIGQVQEEIKRWREDLAERERMEQEEKKRVEEEEAELREQEAANPTPPTTVPAPTPVEPEPTQPRTPGSGG